MSTHRLDTIDLAIEAMKKIMIDEKAPPSVRLKAAKAVAENSLHLLQASDVLQRLEALEARISSQKPSYPRL